MSSALPFSLLLLLSIRSLGYDSVLYPVYYVHGLYFRHTASSIFQPATHASDVSVPPQRVRKPKKKSMVTSILQRFAFLCRSCSLLAALHPLKIIKMRIAHDGSRRLRLTGLCSRFSSRPPVFESYQSLASLQLRSRNLLINFSNCSISQILFPA